MSGSALPLAERGRAQLTLGDRWPDHFLAGMTCVHTLLGQATPVVPMQSPTHEILIQVLNDLAAGTYRLSNYFRPGAAPGYTLVVQPPALTADAQYLLLGLNAFSARSQFVSMVTGGVVFEDPFWAILAAHAVWKTSNPRLAVPKAKDNQELWNNVALAVAAVKGGTYRPHDFFAPIEGFIPPAAASHFRFLTVDANQVAPLRVRGVQSLRVALPAEWFELFTP